jgi:hypothetical protein
MLAIMFLVKNCVFKRNSFLWLLLVGSVMLLKYSVIAKQSVTLGWDPSSDPNTLGYNIYYGTVSHEYISKASAGNGTTVTISGLDEGVTYYFAATTFDIFNQESGFSDEMPYIAQPPKVKVPLTKNVVIGQNVVFNVTSKGTSQLSYKWKFNSAEIPSATNTVLSLMNITANQAGVYSVTVSDVTGLTTNITINLVVFTTATATLTRPTYTAGRYTFAVSGVKDFEYIVEASTNLVDWVLIQTNTAPFNCIDTDANHFAQRFYRSFATFNRSATTNAAPADSQPVLAPSATLTQATYANGLYSFNVSGEPGSEYTVQASTNLVDWVSVQTNLAPFTFVDSNANQFAQRFYRTLSTSSITASLTVDADTGSYIGFGGPP